MTPDYRPSAWADAGGFFMRLLKARVVEDARGVPVFRRWAWSRSKRARLAGSLARPRTWRCRTPWTSSGCQRQRRARRRAVNTLTFSGDPGAASVGASGRAYPPLKSIAGIVPREAHGA
jgi:hypothetical protein